MLPTQTTMELTAYSSLYDIVVPKDNLLRKIKEMVDFSFVYDELKSKYSIDKGREAEDPIRMFKYLMIKNISGLSDIDLVDHCKYDMSYKFFLDLAPEANVIDDTTLSYFRRKRLKDVNLLDMLITKSIEIAVSKGINMGKTIIVDSTHSMARSNPVIPAGALQKQAKILRKVVYVASEQTKEKVKEGMPKKYEGSDLEKQLDYVTSLLGYLKEKKISKLPAVFEKMNLLEEMIGDVKDHFSVSVDKDARMGHKSADSGFYGYKGHLAVTPDRLVAAATMTSGEKADGPQLPELIQKAKENMPDLEEVVGDAAYSGQANLENAEKEGVTIIAKVNGVLLTTKNERKGFTYNKDAHTMVCPAGELPQLVEHANFNNKKVQSHKDIYYFPLEKCRVCAHAEECGFVIGAKKKRGRKYCVTVHTEQQNRQIERQKTDEFREKYKVRYIVEAKNSELKHSYHMDRAISYGLDAFTMQGAVAIFMSNLVRISRITDEKTAK